MYFYLLPVLTVCLRLSRFTAVISSVVFATVLLGFCLSLGLFLICIFYYNYFYLCLMTLYCLIKVRYYGQHFSSTCLAALLHCKLKHTVARITTFVANLSRYKIQCCKLRQHVAQSRLEFYFLQQILVSLLVLPLKLQLVSQQIQIQRSWLAFAKPSNTAKYKINLADREDREFEVNQ